MCLENKGNGRPNMKTGRIVPKSEIDNRVNAPQGELLHAGGAKDGPSNGSSAGGRKGIESAITLPSQGRDSVERPSQQQVLNSTVEITEQAIGLQYRGRELKAAAAGPVQLTTSGTALAASRRSASQSVVPAARPPILPGRVWQQLGSPHTSLGEPFDV